MTRSPTQQHPQQQKPRRRRGCLTTLGIGALVLAVLVGAGGWLVNTHGPRFGVYLFPPAPEQYAEVALGFMDAGGSEWDAARADVERLAADATSIEELHEPLAQAARVAGGKHSVFLTPDEAEQTAQTAEANFTTPTVTTDSGITTVTIPPLGSVSTDQQTEYADTAAQGIVDAAPNTCGWIVDLRGNTGGDMYPMLSGVAPLLPNGPALSFVTNGGQETVVTVQDDGAGLDGDTTASIPVTGKVREQPVAILQDGRTGSSGEAVLTAFRGLDNVHSFGMPSAGYTSANAIHQLYDGAQLVLTGSVYADRDGIILDEQPIEPSSSVDADQIERAAQDWLTQNGCE
ncbi:S41 family peptidase [Microbacterium sp. CH-015]|uniref:S41 family peptidase n=1 Tax=Microbacterium sp. CH-015 TaxID=3406734 RepID=UPI003C771400